MLVAQDKVTVHLSSSLRDSLLIIQQLLVKSNKDVSCERQMFLGFSTQADKTWFKRCQENGIHAS